MTAEKNLGDHINTVFKDRSKMLEAQTLYPPFAMHYSFPVLDSFGLKFSKAILKQKTWNQTHQVLDRLIPPEVSSKPVLTATPTSSIEEFWLPLRAFDYSANGKNGCGVLKLPQKGYYISENYIVLNDMFS